MAEVGVLVVAANGAPRMDNPSHGAEGTWLGQLSVGPPKVRLTYAHVGQSKKGQRLSVRF
jgi:hypothetical protein